MESRRIKDYTQFLRSIKMDESLSGIPSNGSFSPYSKVMLEWCGFEKSDSGGESYNLGIKGKDADGEYNLFTSVSPDDGGAKAVFVVLAQGDYLKDLIRGSQKKTFRGPKSRILGDILLRLKKSSGGQYKESFMLADKEDDLKIYGSEKAADEKWYTFTYVVGIGDMIEILPIWSDFMSYIGFAPKSQMKNNKQGTGKYFGPAIMKDFIQKSSLRSSNVKRLEFIFPGSWDEYAVLQWAKEFGLLAPIFKSLKEATEFLKSFDKVKFNEVVVGSHGSDTDRYADMIESLGDTDSHHQDVREFLEQIARITDVDSKVYFTSCYAGNSEDKLVRVAEIIGCTVYGSEDINYLGFKSESGKFWMAKPDGTFKITGDRPPFVLDFGPGSFLNGLSMAAQSVTMEQVSAIRSKIESIIDEWKKFEKNPWGYMASSCSNYIEEGIKKYKNMAVDSIKKIQDMWNSW